MQGNLGSDGTLSAVYNYRWNQALVTKTNAQVMAGSAQGLLQIDNDYTGADFSASLKAFNPSVFEGGLTGIFVGSYPSPSHPVWLLVSRLSGSARA
jgi:mitochondrial import receptor subunit TOM40